MAFTRTRFDVEFKAVGYREIHSVRTREKHQSAFYCARLVVMKLDVEKGNSDWEMQQKHTKLAVPLKMKRIIPTLSTLLDLDIAFYS